MEKKAPTGVDVTGMGPASSTAREMPKHAVSFCYLFSIRRNAYLEGAGRWHAPARFSNIRNIFVAKYFGSFVYYLSPVCASAFQVLSVLADTFLA